MATKSSSSAERYYSAYKSNKTWEVNRKARLQRTQKAQPLNEQVAQALKGMVYRRKTPTKSMWSHSAKAAAQLYKQFSGRFDMNILSSDPKLQHAATQIPSKREIVAVANTSQYASFFAMGARIHGIR